MTHFLAGKRAKELETLATRQGFAYVASDRTAAMPCSLLTQAEDRNVPENVVRGAMRGKSFTAFDFTYLEDLDAKRQRPTDRPWVPYESPAQFTCVVVDLGAAIPETVINPRGKKRLFDVELQLETGHPALDELFQVWSSLPSMARWLNDERFCDFLANTRGQFAFELRPDGLVCIASDVRAQDVLGLIAMAVACSDSLPPGLLKAYQVREPEPEPEQPVAAPEDDAPTPDVPAPATSGGTATEQPAGQITDLRDVRSSRNRLKAGRRSAMPGTSRAADAPTTELPPPPSPEAWAAWVEAHADEVASWSAPDVDLVAAEEEPADWSTMSAEERAAELAQLQAMADEGLITAEELREAMEYLGSS